MPNSTITARNRLLFLAFSPQPCSRKIVGRNVRIDVKRNSENQTILSSIPIMGFAQKIESINRTKAHSKSNEKYIMKNSLFHRSSAGIEAERMMPNAIITSIAPQVVKVRMPIQSIIGFRLPSKTDTSGF